jgi:hypothetical protein
VAKVDRCEIGGGAAGSAVQEKERIGRLVLLERWQNDDVQLDSPSTFRGAILPYRQGGAKSALAANIARVGARIAGTRPERK